MRAAQLVHTRRSDGDFRVDRDTAELAEIRSRVAPGRWTWLRQVHGADVVVVDEPGQHAGAVGDAAVTAVGGAVLAVHTADCVPVLFHDPQHGVVGAAHVGWRGLMAGVIETTASAMADLGAEAVSAVVGPHIRGGCYEFGDADLDMVATRYGDDVRSRTADGRPALDLTVGIGRALETTPIVTSVAVEDGCTACEPNAFFSHRARRDTGRHAAVAVLVP